MNELFWVNGWLFIHSPETGCGTVYYPQGEPTLAIAANYGGEGDFFCGLSDALTHFRANSPEVAV